MNHLKMLGLVALTTVALTAAVGAATASAKVCSLAGTGAACGGGHGNEFQSTIKALATAVELKSTLINLTCRSEIKDTITNSGTGAGSVGEFSFTMCRDQWMRECTTEETGLPYASTLAGGTLTFSPTIRFKCSNPNQPLEKITCQYSVTNATPVVTDSGTAPMLIANGVTFTKVAAQSHKDCSASLTWHGEYGIWSPTSLWQT